MKKKTKPLAGYQFLQGPAGLKLSWQGDFPAKVNCDKCGGKSRHAISVMEQNAVNCPSLVGPFISRRYPNEGEGGFWPHDAIAFALYFCRDCFHAQVEWNQA